MTQRNLTENEEAALNWWVENKISYIARCYKAIGLNNILAITDPERAKAEYRSAILSKKGKERDAILKMIEKEYVKYLTKKHSIGARDAVQKHR